MPGQMLFRNERSAGSSRCCPSDASTSLRFASLVATSAPPIDPFSVVTGDRYTSSHTEFAALDSRACRTAPDSSSTSILSSFPLVTDDHGSPLLGPCAAAHPQFSFFVFFVAVRSASQRRCNELHKPYGQNARSGKPRPIG